MEKIYEQYKENIAQPFSLKYKESSLEAKNTYHIHDVLEVVLVRSEGMVLLTAEQEFSVEKNTLLLFNHMDLHFNKMPCSDHACSRYVLFFSPEFVNGLSTEKTNLLDCFYLRPFENPWMIPLKQEEADDCAELLDKIMETEKQKEKYGAELYMRLLLGEVLMKVNEAYRAYHHMDMQVYSEKYGKIYQMMDEIHHRYAENLNLDLLAKKFFINKFQLCNMFRKVTGMSLNQYVIRCRILKAKELLLQGARVEEVCERTGYNSLAHFSRSFKKKCGESPKQFQMRNRLQKK